MNIILPVVYWCEAWSLTISEEHGLRGFESRVLRKKFTLKGKSIYPRTGEFYYIYTCPVLFRQSNQ
jgi:hypothetical protein